MTDADVSRENQAQLGGWTHDDHGAIDEYGQGASLPILARDIGKLRYGVPEVELP